MTTTTSKATKLMTWTHNGFHGHTTVSVRVPATAKPGDVIEVSSAVARRLNQAVCGQRDCQCGEAVAAEYDGHGNHTYGRWYVTIYEDGETQRGNYPQQ